MQPVLIPSKGEKLLGTMFIANGEGPHPILILLHGFPGNETNFDLAHIVRRMGWNVLVFHYRGSWGSSGKYSFSNCLEDVHSAIDYLKNTDVKDKYRGDSTRIVLAGHSLGGFAALMTAAERDDITHAASFAGFNFGLFADYLLSNKEFLDITMEGLNTGAQLLTGVTGTDLFNEMVENKDHWNLLNKAKAFEKKSLLLVGAKNDFVAPMELHHSPLEALLKSMNTTPKKAYAISSGHSFSSSRIKLAEIFSKWIRGIEI